MGPAGSALSSGQMPMQMVLWGSLAAVAMFFLITFLILLCSSCDREKPRQHSGDHENLMNVPSDKEMFSHSATSLTTDALASSDQNGVLTNGDTCDMCDDYPREGRKLRGHQQWHPEPQPPVPLCSDTRQLEPQQEPLRQEKQLEL